MHPPGPFSNFVALSVIKPCASRFIGIKRVRALVDMQNLENRQPRNPHTESSTQEAATATGQGKSCCSSPEATCYWFAVSLAAWGVLSLAGSFWRPLRGSSAATIILAMAIGCFANWFKNRTLHCGITGPLFVIVALLFLFSDINLIHINPSLIWPIVLVGVGIAFLLEWRYAGRSV